MSDEIEKRRRIRAADSDRDAVLDVLQSAHANGRLDPMEVDERQTKALEAKFLDELPELISDLPEGQDLDRQLDRIVGQGSGASQALNVRHRASVPATGEPMNRVAVMSGTSVVVPQGTPEIASYNFMGGDTLDLRDALGPGQTITLTSYSLMAGHDILVAPGTRVDDRTLNLMGGNDVHGKAGDGSEGTLVLKGVSIMAGHDIKVREA